ncbi:hypothetical protein FRB96_000986 [Tulasnella sp. 330]|nr:hypothetical protein FRB96_000986 [Tulasnella sp. 330]KAG8882565.1 hypothetical protein FRB98_003606 [Tulasnella sp. 332]
MIIPSVQNILATGMALTGLTSTMTKPHSVITKGKVLDFAVEECIDKDANQRCTKPFLVSKDTCYQLEWKTDGTLTHTTAEVRDAGSDEIVYYRDTNGEWTPEKGELVYIDFKPKVPATGNSTVYYKVYTCE